MGKTPTNLTLHDRVLDLARQLQDRLGYSSLSGLVEQLIREEYERRNGVILVSALASLNPTGQSTPETLADHAKVYKGPKKAAPASAVSH